MATSRDRNTPARLEEDAESPAVEDGPADEGALRRVPAPEHALPASQWPWWKLAGIALLVVCAIVIVAVAVNVPFPFATGALPEPLPGDNASLSPRFAPALEPHPLAGTKAAVWLAPTGMAAWAGSSPGLPWDMGSNPWWLHDANWTHWTGRAAADIALLRQGLGGGPNATAIVYFPAYLADEARWGAAPLRRLGRVVASLAAGGVRPQLLIGRPDVGASGEWLPSSDPVHDPAARGWLMDRVRDVLALPVVQSNVVFVSVYWMGASAFCSQGSGCSEAEVADYNAALADTVAAAGSRFRLLMHLDGMFQDACWPVPCATWDHHGYTPRSVNGSWGLLVESWVQGSLRPAIQRLYDEGVTSADRLLLLQDIRNCDQPGVPACVMGSVQADVDAWFDTLRQLGLCSSSSGGGEGSAAGSTFGVWAFADVPPLNEFGDALANGTGLTAKGAANRAKSLSPTC